MKTFKFSLLALLFISFISCSSDSDDPEEEIGEGTISSEIVDEWNLEAWDYSMTSSFEGVSVTTLGEAKDINASLKFNSDNTFNFQGNYTIIMDIEGITNEMPVNGASSTGDYSIDGYMLNLSNTLGEMQGQQVPSSGGGEMEIVEISENTLILRGEQEIVTEMAGMTSRIEVNEYYEFSR